MQKYAFLKFRWRTLIYIFLTIYSMAYIMLNFGMDTLPLSTNKCPACYGSNICSELENYPSRLLFPSNLKIFNIFFNIKNVFYFERYHLKYVAKELAHDSELKHFDETMCKESGFNLSCNVSEAIMKLTSVYDNNIAAIVKGTPSLFDKTDLIKCNQPTTLDYLFSQYVKLDSSVYAIQHFITILAINPEPLIIQAHYEELPLPNIFGMCGRLFVESYEGKRLALFYDSDWMERAYLSLQLLHFAVRSSENNWKLFLLDVSPNNFAVDSSYNVKLIDVENILILDSTASGLSESPYQNDGKGCLDCLSFVYEDLCNYQINDHNYFAICKGLLAPSSFSNDMPDGLLHSIPDNIIQRYSNFENILQECAYPDRITRKEAAFLLVIMLKNITSPKYPI